MAAGYQLWRWPWIAPGYPVSRLWNRNFPIQLAPRHLRKIPSLAHLGEPDAQLNRLFAPLVIIAFRLGQLGIDRT